MRTQTVGLIAALVAVAIYMLALYFWWPIALLVAPSAAGVAIVAHRNRKQPAACPPGWTVQYGLPIPPLHAGVTQIPGLMGKTLAYFQADPFNPMATWDFIDAVDALDGLTANPAPRKLEQDIWDQATIAARERGLLAPRKLARQDLEIITTIEVAQMSNGELDALRTAIEAAYKRAETTAAPLVILPSGCGLCAASSDLYEMECPGCVKRSGRRGCRQCAEGARRYVKGCDGCQRRFVASYRTQLNPPAKPLRNP